MIKDLSPALYQTNFFVIPHHGRRDAYSPELLGLLPNLQMGIISDGREVPTSVTPMYSRYFDGWPVWNVNTKRREWRRILTTRNDGHVWLRVGISTDGACRTVVIGSRGRHG